MSCVIFQIFWCSLWHQTWRDLSSLNVYKGEWDLRVVTEFISHTNSLYSCRRTIQNIVQKLYGSLLWYFYGAFFDCEFLKTSLCSKHLTAELIWLWNSMKVSNPWIIWRNFPEGSELYPHTHTDSGYRQLRGGQLDGKFPPSNPVD